MKPIFRLMIIIVPALLIVSFIGCGEDDKVNKKDRVVIHSDIDIEPEFDFVDTSWQIASIDGQEFEELFKPEEQAEIETEFMYGGNSWTFDTDGSFAGMLKFTLTEKYEDPVYSMIQEVIITSEGEYTADDTTLKITKSDVTVIVDFTFEPMEVWVGETLFNPFKALEQTLKIEAYKLMVKETASDALFKVGSGYTWGLDEDTLMLSNSHQEILLDRVSE